MNDVMIDLETLGTSQDAAFIAIGACRFDRYTGEIGEVFSVNVDMEDAVAQRSVSGDTIKWWFKQSNEARKHVTQPGMPLKLMLSQFSAFLNKDDVVWGNGATFDIAILENAYAGHAPWKFWNVRDVRTLVDISGMNPKDFPFQGTRHEALSDAIHQAKYCAEMMRVIRESIHYTRNH